MMPGPRDDSLTAAFSPRGVCVVGASERQWSYGRRTVENLLRHGFAGPIVPVNPRYSEVAGLTCLPSVTALAPGLCDLAIVLTRADGVPGLLGKLAGSGVRTAVVFSSPPPGRSLQDEIANAVAATGIRVLGFGASLISVRSNLVAGAFSAAWAGGLVDAPVAVVSQSGGVLGSALNYLLDAGSGFRWLVSVGSAIDVSLPEILGWLRTRHELAAIGLFVEGERDGPALRVELLAARRDGVRVVAIKVGASETARRIAETHTGAATGDDRVWNEVLREAGVARVTEVADMCGLLEGFARARRVAASASTSGVVVASVGSAGAAALTADALARAGVPVLEYTEEEKVEVARRLPSGEPVNPVDLAGIKGFPNEEVGALRELLEVWGKSPRVSGILVVLPTMGYEGPAAAVVGEAWATLDKPLAVAWVAGSMGDPGRLALRRLGVPSFDRIELAVRFLRILVADAATDKREAEALPRRANLLDAEEAVQRLMVAGVPFPARRAIAPKDVKRLSQPVEGVGEPWVVKLQAAGVAHKAELGAVLLRERPGDATVGRVLAAVERLRADGVEPTAIVVEEFVDAPVELFAAVVADETFGLVSMLGLGGARVDRLSKPALKLGVPTPAELLELLEASGAADDVRRAGVDPALAAPLLRDLFSALAHVADDPAVTAVELNPVALRRADPLLVALDAKVALQDEVRAAHEEVVLG
jgi:acyl-CoA synthetase (NDP forming)